MTEQRIEMALADIKLLYREGEHEIDGVTIELLPGAEEWISSRKR